MSVEEQQLSLGGKFQSVKMAPDAAYLSSLIKKQLFNIETA